MKTFVLRIVLFLFFLPIVSISAHEHNVAEYIDVGVYGHYKYKPDNSIGRELYIRYSGPKKFSKGNLIISSRLGVETIPFKTESVDSISLLLPEGLGVNRNDTVIVCLQAKGVELYKKVAIPAMRYWTVYIYPHSHVDIGYTNTQENVEFIHKRNLDVAIELAEKTSGYPEDARFKWNPEVLWPVERYLASSSDEKKNRLLAAIKSGQINLDAAYISTNTSANSDEELLELFDFSKKMEVLTGRKVETMVQVDIPGLSWGIVPASNFYGIKYCLSLFNGYDRTGFSDELSFKPFWWLGPDGKSKVLFLQPGSYNPGALIKGKYFWPQLAGETDQSKLLRVVKTSNPRANFIDSYLSEKLPMLEKDKDYIYDIFPMTWCMADNTPIDADLPDAVKSWNEEYAYPHLKICSGTEMMDAFAEYGDKIPTLSGDYTEYWTDGLGSSAKYSGKSREVKERLVQSEILWSMLNPGVSAPEKITKEAWRNILLSTEHTWAFMDPNKESMQNKILNVKYGYFDKAEHLTNTVMECALSNVKSEKSGKIAVYNTNSWKQTSLVTLDSIISKNYITVLDENGNEVLSQRLSTGELAFIAENVPSLGKRIYCLSKKKSSKLFEKDGLSDKYVIDNGIVSVKIDQFSGDVISIVYADKEYVDNTSVTAVNSYRYLERDLTAGFARRPYNVKIVKKENGPIVYSFLITSLAQGVKSLTREVRIVAGSPEVTFINTVDKLAIVEKEAIHFGFSFNVPNGKTIVNIPWGSMELEKDQLKAGNRNWITTQRWVDISNDDKGVIWCPLNSAVFESGDMTANIMDLAEYSPQWIKYLPESSTIYSWAMNNHWITNFPLSQEGIVTFKYVVKPHQGGFDEMMANRFGLEKFRPLVVAQVNPESIMPGTSVPGEIELLGSNKVYLSNYRTVENGKSSVLRFISLSDKNEIIKLNTKGRKVSAAYIVTEGLDEGKLINVALSGIIVPANGATTIKIVW